MQIQKVIHDYDLKQSQRRLQFIHYTFECRVTTLIVYADSD